MSIYRNAPSPTSSEDEEMVAALFPQRPQELFPQPPLGRQMLQAEENVQQQPLTPSIGIGMSYMDIKDKPDDQSKAISSNVADFLLDLAYEDHKNGGTEYNDLLKLKNDILNQIVEHEGVLPQAGSQSLPNKYNRLVDDIIPYETNNQSLNYNAMGKLDYLVSQISKYKPQISTKDKSLAADELRMKKERIDTLIILITHSMEEIDEIPSHTSTLKRESPQHFASSPSPMKKSKSESELSRPFEFINATSFTEPPSDLSGLSEFEESDNEEPRKGAKSAPPGPLNKDSKKGGLRTRKRKGRKHKTTKKRGKKRTMKRRKRRKQKTRKSLR